MHFLLQTPDNIQLPNAIGAAEISIVINVLKNFSSEYLSSDFSLANGLKSSYCTLPDLLY